ncbi:centromere kinetochore component CENP-T-domain-containing protein [Biscogniauxia marginata]|nr:centromere kinetochore component CENP-T-domain-containing protein [Biscogniauxia marginata]
MASNNNPSSAQNGRLAPLSTPRMVATPNRRATSIEPLSGRLSASARRNTTATPHARAAIRALDQRRAALFTPGRTRRRSLREQRETPRDLLRNLSRVLAPSTTAVSSSSSSSSPNAQGGNNSTLHTIGDDDDFDDDDFPIERPRFSLPLGPEEDDDDDSELKPPRLSGLEDENYTATSIELPRRAWSEAPLGRSERASLGSIRFSDYIGPELQSDDVGIDSGFFPPPALDDDDDGDMALDEQAMFERLDAEEARRQTLGRQSDFGPIQLPDPENESTFVMAPVESSPVRGQTMTGVIEEEADAHHFYELDDDGNEPIGVPDLEDDNTGIEGPDETTMISQPTQTIELTSRSIRRRKPGKKISRHGIEYPSLPTSVVKRLATTFAKTAGVRNAKISPDTLDAIMQATDWFFEQLGDDLSAYAKHAGRKTIDESDMVTLMRRQRQTSASTTPFALAQRYLPRELLQELRMSVPTPSKAPRKKSKQVGVDGEDEVT